MSHASPRRRCGGKRHFVTDGDYSLLLSAVHKWVRPTKWWTLSQAMHGHQLDDSICCDPACSLCVEIVVYAPTSGTTETPEFGEFPRTNKLDHGLATRRTARLTDGGKTCSASGSSINNRSKLSLAGMHSKRSLYCLKVGEGVGWYGLCFTVMCRSWGSTMKTIYVIAIVVFARIYILQRSVHWKTSRRMQL